MSQESFTLGERIGVGRWRSSYEVAGHPKLCAKVVRDKYVLRAKDFFGDFGKGEDVHGIPLPAFLASLFAFGSTDLNKHELNRLEKLPDTLRDFTLQEARIAHTTEENKSILVAERPYDHDGEFSKTLAETRATPPASFWQHLDRLTEEMKEYDMHFVDIDNPGNILVQKVSETEWRPVFIDVKYAGFNASVPTAIMGLLLGQKGRDKMLSRRLEKLKARHREGVMVYEEMRTAPAFS